VNKRPQNPVLVWIVGWILAVWVWAAIEPFDRGDWLLENLLVFVYGAALCGSYRHFVFSNRAYALFAVFLTLHLVGAHYTYSEVPIGAWAKERFALERNHFDRLVHFSYGLLLTGAFREVLSRAVKVARGWAAFLAITLVLAFSAFFEVVEALVAIVVSPELGAAYLGIQGDIWDAQKDMALAVVGAAVATGAASGWERRMGFTSARG
jgi:putative membrane protein